MDGSNADSESNGPNPLLPDEAFALLNDDTRIGILQALWDTFESGSEVNHVPYTELMNRVGIRDSGNFSYHLQQLIGHYVRKTDDGYQLKQVGINIVRAVVAGTVTEDPTIDWTLVDMACPICDAPVEVAYVDEVMAASCTACDGILRWKGNPGILFLGFVPPSCIEERTARAALLAAITYTFHEMATLFDGVCPHCSRSVRTDVDVCPDHDPGPDTLCRNCDRRHLAEVRIVCATCKRSVFPPVATAVLAQPAVIAFYQDHGIDHRFASWDTVERRTQIGEELLSRGPLRLDLTIPAGNDHFSVTVDEELRVVDGPS